MYQEKVDYAKYAVDSSKPHTLNENYTHKKICRFMYNGTKYNVTDWTDALIKICNILDKKPKKTFETLNRFSEFQRADKSHISWIQIR